MVKSIYTTAILLLIAVAFSAFSTGVYTPASAVVKKNHKLARKMTLSSKKVTHVHVRSHKIALRAPKVVKTEPTAPIDITNGNTTLLFQRQKGHLPWPVDSRKVTMRFGLQSYIPGVRIYNLGINIAIDKDSTVRAVYDGVVDDVMDIGDGKAVMVLHGKFFTIYSDLSKATVVRGQQVTAGDALGQVGATGALEFRIYDPHDVWMDPQKWLTGEKPAK